MAAKIPLRYLRLRDTPILRQLQIEEALFRLDSGKHLTHNYFIYNDKTPEPAIVMGIGGKPELLVHQEAAKLAKIPIIKRYTGGGTVVIDQNTIFTTFLCNLHAFPHVLPYPREIMKWSETFYKPFFQRICPEHDFCLQEDDYAFGKQKCGGNAQSISRGQWVHHTSFLWNYSKDKMQLLQQPKRQPKYREQREHNDFLIPLQSIFGSDNDDLESSNALERFATELRRELENWFEVDDISIDEVSELIDKPHRKTTRILSD